MPTFVSGLPLHALVVHAVVVLVPMAVLGAVLIAVWPAARRRYRWPVLALTALATDLIELAEAQSNPGAVLEDAVKRLRDVERLEALHERAQRGDGPQADGRIVAVDRLRQAHGILCTHGRQHTLT